MKKRQYVSEERQKQVDRQPTVKNSKFSGVYMECVKFHTGTKKCKANKVLGTTFRVLYVLSLKYHIVHYVAGYFIRKMFPVCK